MFSSLFVKKLLLGLSLLTVVSTQAMLPPCVCMTVKPKARLNLQTVDIAQELPMSTEEQVGQVDA